MRQVYQKAPAVANDQAPHDGADVVPIAAEDREVTNPPESRAPATQRYLLVLQFAVFNLAAFALLGAAGVQGWLATIVEADGTGLSVGIFAVFLAGLAVCAGKIWTISTELNCVRNFDPCRRSSAATYLAGVAGRGSGSRAITASAPRKQK